MEGISRIKIKTALRKSREIDHYFGSRYSFSPYRACSHDCAYCDGRAERYYVEGNFSSSIVIRENLPEVLKKDLERLREKGFILAGSGVTDAYQPIEKKEKLMARAAELLAEKGFPAVLVTKSVLPMRDMEIWRKVNDKSRFILLLTICSVNEEERSNF